MVDVGPGWSCNILSFVERRNGLTVKTLLINVSSSSSSKEVGSASRDRVAGKSTIDPSPGPPVRAGVILTPICSRSQHTSGLVQLRKAASPAPSLSSGNCWRKFLSTARLILISFSTASNIAWAVGSAATDKPQRPPLPKAAVVDKAAPLLVLEFPFESSFESLVCSFIFLAGASPRSRYLAVWRTSLWSDFTRVPSACSSRRLLANFSAFMAAA